MLRVLWGVALAAAASVSYRVTHDKLDVTTGLIFLAAIWAGLFAVVELTMRQLRCAAETRANIRTLVTTVGIMLIAVELVLRAGLGGYATYQEKAEGRSYQRQRHLIKTPSWFRVHQPHIDFTYRRQEFAFPRHTNDLGLSEADIPPEKPAGEYRIVALGDSFTEGVGTSYDSTWVKVMEREVAARSPGRKVTTINAGIAGSDICAEYMLFREKLVSYHPDLVIVATNFTDVEDIMLRGGLERFRPNGSVGVPYAAPPWEWLYGISYLSRPVVHGVLGYDDFLIERSVASARQQAAVADMRATVTAFTTLARERGFRLLFLLHPVRGEAEAGQYDPAFDGFVADLKQMPGVDIVDALGYWHEKQIMTIENAPSFYWPIDGHNNIRGYAILGQAVADQVIRLDLLRRP